MTLIIENAKLVKLLTDKEVIVKEGRKISSDLEVLGVKIRSYENKEKAITAKCEPKELMVKGDALNKELGEKMKALQEVVDEISKVKLASIPLDMKAEHEALLKKRNDLEQERNKLALKVQKIKDRAVPIIQKEVKPLLKEYDDIETAKVKDGKVIIETFNYLEQFYKKHKK